MSGKKGRSSADGGLQQPLSSTLKHPDKRLVFKPFDSNVTEFSQAAAKEDGSRVSTRSSKKKQTIRLFSSDAEDEEEDDDAKAQTLTESGARRGGRFKKTQSASDIESKAPKLRSIVKKPAVKKVELKSKLKKQAALHLQQQQQQVAEEEEPAVSGKKDKSQSDENEKPKKPVAAAAAKRAPRMLAIISDKDDLLKHVVCDNKTKYTTTTSTPQFRRRKLKVQEDLSIICKSDSPQAPPPPSKNK